MMEREGGKGGKGEVNLRRRKQFDALNSNEKQE